MWYSQAVVLPNRLQRNVLGSVAMKGDFPNQLSDFMHSSIMLHFLTHLNILVCDVSLNPGAAKPTVYAQY